MKSYSPWDGPTLENYMKDSVLLEGLHTAAGEEFEEEGAEERKCHRLTTAPILHPPALNRERRGCITVQKKEVEPRK